MKPVEMQSDKAPVFVVGSGRSGTTWVLDAIAEANGMNIIFEPMHPILGATTTRFANRYLTAADSEPELSRFMGEIVSGRHPGFWTRYRERPERLYPSLVAFRSVSGLKHWLKRWQYVLQHHQRFKPRAGRPLIVKFIRVNLMLEWLKASFPCRILYVLRHPLAVVESKLRLGGEDWEHQALLKSYFDDPRLQSDVTVDWAEVRRASAASVVGANSAIWCIENVVPLSQAAKLGLVTTFYEDLIGPDGLTEWRRIIGDLGLSNIPSAEYLRLPSQQASHETRKRLAEESLGGLGDVRRRLGEVKVAEISDMLRRFNLRVYDAYQDRPVGLSSQDF
ncbi:sulfotransferase [Thiocapsa marina]|uniref:Sulfotransferase n=1 Tax=Thiocapsa marina 5811 TaxID=768671 RepID=F9UIJ4_9GAMM|nr:sulfotransferase [Thiocapsa marina]EGV15976.1 hypothetical protein ThimaDRAFT_4747 [Thiocapsa marina 5811]